MDSAALAADPSGYSVGSKTSQALHISMVRNNFVIQVVIQAADSRNTAAMEDGNKFDEVDILQTKSKCGILRRLHKNMTRIDIKN